MQIAERGQPRPAPPRAADAEAGKRREREDLEASVDHTRKLLGL